MGNNHSTVYLKTENNQRTLILISKHYKVMLKAHISTMHGNAFFNTINRNFGNKKHSSLTISKIIY
jgi:hypothetical protein